MARFLPLLGVGGKAADSSNTLLDSLFGYYVFSGGTVSTDGLDSHSTGNHFDVERNSAVTDATNGGKDGNDCSEWTAASSGNYEISNKGTGWSSVSQMSVGGWIYPDTVTGDQATICLWDTGAADNMAWAFILSGDELRGYIGQSGDQAAREGNYITTDAANLTTATWHHVMMVFDGGLSGTNRIKLYHNSDLEARTETGTVPAATGTAVNSGADHEAGSAASATQWYFDGRMQHWKIWRDRALSDSDVADDYNGGSVLPYASYQSS